MPLSQGFLLSNFLFPSSEVTLSRISVTNRRSPPQQNATMNHHNTRRHPATQSQSHTHSPSPKRSDHTQSTATSSLSRPQSKTRRSATSASATNRHQLDSKSLLEPSDRLTTLSRRVSGEITLLKEAARKENIEVKEYYKDEG